MVVKFWFGNEFDETFLFHSRILDLHLSGKTEENFSFDRI